MSKQWSELARVCQCSESVEPSASSIKNEYFFKKRLEAVAFSRIVTEFSILSESKTESRQEFSIFLKKVQNRSGLAVITT